jgi:hypothetical protein
MGFGFSEGIDKASVFTTGAMTCRVKVPSLKLRQVMAFRIKRFSYIGQSIELPPF